jgi:hypothetical protein
VQVRTLLFFINAFLRSISSQTQNGAEFETFVKEPVPADWLLGVLSSADWRLALLTALAQKDAPG